MPPLVKIGCGVQLYQVTNGQERTTAFASKTFTEAEQRWSTIKQETFAMFWPMKKWVSMLLGHHFHAFTDHHNILQLAKSVVPKLVRWRLQMQQFNYTVIHVAGEDVKHAIADCLSRLHGPPRGIHSEWSVSTAAVTCSQTSAEKLDKEGTVPMDVESVVSKDKKSVKFDGKST